MSSAAIVQVDTNSMPTFMFDGITCNPWDWHLGGGGWGQIKFEGTTFGSQ